MSSTVIVIFPIGNCSATANDVIYVDDDYNASAPGWGVTKFSSIQRAIENVSDAGTVHVAPGYYWERNRGGSGTDCVVNISKPLNLIGEDRNITIINGTHDHQILIYSSNVVVSNFSLWGMGQSNAIQISPEFGDNGENITNVTISRCFANNTASTLFLLDTGPNVDRWISYVTIEDCEFNTSAWTSVKFNHVGAYLDQSIHHCKIVNNTFYQRGIGFYGGSEGFIHNNIISGNSFHGSRGNYPAIRLFTVDSWYNTIKDNNIQNQQWGGIQVAGQFNVIYNNTINCSNPDTYGIIITGGENNTIYHNNLVNNAQNGYDTGANNIWYNSAISEGNYWSNYDESSEGAWDNDSDGIADDPYVILGDSDNKDNYPFMNPYGWQFPTGENPLEPPDSSTSAKLYVVLADEEVQIKKNTVIKSGDVGANSESNGESATVKIDKNVKVQDSSSKIKGDYIKLKQYSEVQDIYYNYISKHKDAMINGAENIPLDLPVASLPPFPSFTTGIDNIIVEKNKEYTLNEGDYGDINVKRNGKLIFIGGIYNINTLTAKKSVELVFLDRSEVRVDNKLIIDRNCKVGPDARSSISASDIVFYVKGVDTVKIGEGGTLDTNIYAPNSTILLGRNIEATGSYIGNNVIIGRNIQLTLDSAFQ